MRDKADSIKVLFIGDIIGRPGRNALKRFLPGLRAKYKPDFVLANGENAAGGAGITAEIGKDLFAEVDAMTSGNHIWDKKEAIPYLEKETRLLRPANYPAVNPGRGAAIVTDGDGRKLGVLSLQGRVFMEPIEDPFRTADAEIEKLAKETKAIIIDFHAEATSEKVALGWYLDGRVSAVFGTHTHVPTADERILPGGTAFISDVGMAGARDSVIGIKREQSIEKFLTGRPVRFEPSNEGAFLSAVFVEIDPVTGRTRSLVRILEAEDGGED